MRIMIITVFMALSFSMAFGQENDWGQATPIDNYQWDDTCGNYYGYGSPSITPNDSLLFLIHACENEFRLAYSRFLDGQWQNPVDLGIQGFDPFVKIESDTTIFFSANNETGNGNRDIWAGSFRNGQIDSIWNLNPPINSGEEEGSPSLTADGSRLYFLRGQNIMYSDIVNGQYSEPVTLPEIINSANLRELNPEIFPDGSKLYFNRSYGIIAPCIMFVSHIENGIWQEPQRLNDCINFGNPYPDDNYDYSCDPNLTRDGHKMYFTRIGFAGGEMGSGIMVSELMSGISSQPGQLPTRLGLNAYPNPFNSQVLISIDGELNDLAEVNIYNLTGQKIRQLPPSNNLIWDGRDLDGHQVGSGIYFIKADSKDRAVSLKLTLLR
jgi:hypothetical protein